MSAIKDSIVKYKINQLVKVRRWKTFASASGSKYNQYWVLGIIIGHLDKTRMRTGIARFEILNVYEILIEGTVQKIPSRDICSNVQS